MPGRQWPGAVARRVGLSGEISFTTTRVGQTLHLPCGRGPHLVDFRITGNMPPDFVAKKLMQNGWTIGSRLLCPEHSGAHKHEKGKPDMPNEQSALAAPLASAKPAASDIARTARREALQWLSESFDVATGRYSGDVSDAWIAKETKLAERAVAALREEFYGPLKEPSEIEEFRGALKVAREEITAGVEAMRQSVRALELRLDRLAAKYGKP